MAIVIHTINGHRYAYLHFRVGNRIDTKYLYPCNSKGKQIPPEHGGGAPSQGKTHEPGAPKPRGGARVHKPRPGKPVAPEPAYMGHQKESQEIKSILDILTLKGIKHLYKWEGQQIGSDVTWSIPGTQESTKVTQSKDVSTMNPTTWAVSFGGLHAVSFPGALTFDSVTDATLYARRYMERYVMGSDTLNVLQNTFKDILSSVPVPPKEQPRQPGFTPFEGKKPPVIELPKIPEIIKLPEIVIKLPWQVGMTEFAIMKGYVLKTAEGLEHNTEKSIVEIESEHIDEIRKAIAAGLAVPQAVLDEYPTIFRKTPEPEKKKPEPPVIKLPEVKIPEIKIPEVKIPGAVRPWEIPFAPVVFKSVDEGLKVLGKFVKSETSTIQVKVTKSPKIKAEQDKWYQQYVDLRATDPKASHEMYVKYLDAANKTLKGVEFEEAKPAVLTSIYAGLEKSVGKWGVKLDNVGWAFKRHGRAWAVYSSNRGFTGDSMPTNTRINFVKSSTQEFKKSADAALVSFSYQQVRERKNIEEGLADEKRPQAYKDLLIARRAILDATTRWNIATIAKDPLESVGVHEGYHAVYYHYGLVSKWAHELTKNGVERIDKFAVSEYGASSESELFAEVGSAVEEGIKIPAKVLNAFNATMQEAQEKWDKTNTIQTVKVSIPSFSDSDKKAADFLISTYGLQQALQKLDMMSHLMSISDEARDSYKAQMKYAETLLSQSTSEPKKPTAPDMSSAINRYKKEISDLRDDIYTEEKSNDSAAVKADKIAICNTMIRDREERVKELEAEEKKKAGGE